MNEIMSEFGRDLNIKYKTVEPIFTPDEIMAAEFLYTEYPVFLTDKNNRIRHHYDNFQEEPYSLQCKMWKLRGRFSHDWNVEMKKEAKQQIIEELKSFGLIFINKVCLTTFADDFDYSNCCYDVRVLVRGSRQKEL